MSNSTSCFVKIIKEICGEEGICLESFGDDWVFRLEKEGKASFLLGYQFGLNLSVSQQICADKSAAAEIMEAHGIPHVPHVCFMSPRKLKYVGKDGNWTGMQELLKRWGKVVVKDNQGTGGELVYLVKREDELENAAQEIFAQCPSLAVSPYREIQEEYRVILLDGEVKLMFRKERPRLSGDGVRSLRRLYAEYLEKGGRAVSISEKDLDKILPAGAEYCLNWKHNLGQGAKAIAEEGPAEAAFLAKRAAELFQLRFASVDVIAAGGKYEILEINPGVMMENLAASSPEFYRTAKEIYRQAVLLSLS